MKFIDDNRKVKPLFYQCILNLWLFVCFDVRAPGKNLDYQFTDLMKRPLKLRGEIGDLNGIIRRLKNKAIKVDLYMKFI